MPEILTESFCERCGTRYTFESATPRGPRLKGLKVMSRGLKNFVLSDDTSMDEAMAAARNETDREQTAQQLDAFHKTFNFCMSCRQYTCGNCWNEAEGRCLSCAPHLGHEVLQAPFGNVGAGGAINLTDSEAIGLNDRNGNAAGAPAPAEPMAWPEPEPMSWPTSDLMQEEGAQGPTTFQEAIDAAAELEADAAAADVEPIAEDVAAPFDEAPVEAAIVQETEGPTLETAPFPIEEAGPPLVEDEPEEVAPVDIPVAAAPPAPVETVPPAPAIADQDHAAAAAANTSELLQRFRPGQSLDDEIAAYEREQAAATGAAMAAAAEAAAAEADLAEAAARAAAEAAAAELPEPEPEIAAAPQPEPVAAMPEPEPVAPMPEPEPVAAMPEPEPEPVAAMPEPEPEPEPVAAEPAAAAWPEPVAAEPRDDVVYQPTWQIVAPEPPAADTGPVPQAPAPTGPTADPIAASAEPQWPSQPEWPRPPSADGLPFLGRPAATGGGIEALWAESAREVASVGPLPGAKPVGGVQPCVSCGLSLSANARFCRRCGTRQG